MGAYQEYPAYKFHHTKEPVIVRDEAQAAKYKQSDGWHDEPWTEEEKTAKKKVASEKQPMKAKDEIRRDASPRVFQKYPAHRFHKTKKPVIVNSEEDEARRAPSKLGWRDEPHDEGDEQLAPAPAPAKAKNGEQSMSESAPAKTKATK